MTDAAFLPSLLHRQGYRMTPARRGVWEVLCRTQAHLTAEEIATRLQEGPGEDVNLASIYRALSLLEELEVVRASRLGSAGSTTWEVAHPDEHFHLICDHCGVVRHHEGSLVSQIQSHLSTGHDFEVSSVELVVTGRCAACRPT